ncbi:hypothetical protein HZA96_02880 [Candidatus Woesearchaeota archaeon]|nr:hypothetical protein [Candidatus Woesearchaeota archaeon]
MYKKINKTAFIESQLNWIYILVVGALILVFFIVIAKKYMTNQEIKINANVLQQLDTTILGASQAAKAANKINIEDAALTFECSCKGNNCQSNIEIGGSGIAKDTAFLPIFSPKKIEKSQLITWTLDWNYPFKVSNLLYLTRDDAYYYFVADDDEISKQFAKELYEMMAETQFLNVKLLDGSVTAEIYPDNMYLLRFIYISKTGESPSWLDKIKDEKEARNIDLLMLKPEQAGSFSFTKVKKNNKEVASIAEGDGGYYLDIPTLIGAIFSEDELVYHCNLLKAFKRYQYISSLYKYKAEQLKDDNSLSHCSAYYTTAYNSLGITLHVTNDVEVTNAVAAKQSLEDLNEEILLAPGGRCPRLY